MSLLFTISILNWNGKHLLKNSIQSALKQTYKPIEIILVDNGSTDGSIEFVKKLFRNKVKIVKLKQNIGYSGGHNSGFKEASGKWVALMSNDVLLEKNWVKEVIKTTKDDSNISLIGTAWLDKHNNLGNYGNYIDIIGINNSCKEKNRKTVTVAGGVFAVKKEVFDKPYDEDYFIFGEEAYLGFRTLLQDKKIAICENTSYRFQGSGSEASSRLNEKSIFLNERNSIINFLRFFNFKTMFLLLPLLLYHLFTSRILNLLVNKKIEVLISRLKAWFWILKNLKLVFNKRKETRA